MTCLFFLRNQKRLAGVVSGIFILLNVFGYAITYAEPVDPSVRSIADRFSVDVQQEFSLYADSTDGNKVWYVPKWGYINGKSGSPDFAIDTTYDNTGVFDGEILVDFSGTFSIGSNYHAYSQLQQEAAAQGFHLQAVVAESVATDFLISGFEVGGDGKIDAECEFVEYEANGYVFEVPECFGINKYGERVRLDFLFRFDAENPQGEGEGEQKVTADIPFSAVTLPGWEYDLMDIMNTGDNWDRLILALTEWQVKSSSNISLGQVTIQWRKLYSKLRAYFQACDWACTNAEIDTLFASFVQQPDQWGMSIQLQVNGDLEGTPLNEALKTTLRKIIGPEILVKFVDQVPQHSKPYSNIAGQAKVFASSTYCSSGSIAGIHCYHKDKVNDGDKSTKLGGLFSWSNSKAASPTNPQIVSLTWAGAKEINEVSLYTSEGYPIADYEIQVANGAQENWHTVANISGNTALSRHHPFAPVVADRLRVLAKRGPARQPTYVRINELVVSGRPARTDIAATNEFYTLKGNMQKIFFVNKESLQLIWKTGYAMQNPSTVLAMQCMTGGFGSPVTWFNGNDYCSAEPLMNVAPLGVATADSTFCSSGPTHCYDAKKANDGDINSTLGGEHSWSNNRNTSLPQHWILEFEQAVSISSATVVTSKGYEIREYDLQAWDASSLSWKTLASVRNNTKLLQTSDFTTVTTTKFRVVGLRGPNHQPTYVRLNEVLLEGYISKSE